MLPRRPLRIAYRGNFQPNLPEGAEPWSTEWQVAATLEQMGHTVLRLQEDAVDWPVVTAATVGAKADLFLWTQTHNRNPDGAYEHLEAMRKAAIPTVAFHLDLYWGLERAHQIFDYPFWRTDWVFTADGGHQADFERAGIKHRWMSPAVYGPWARVGTPNGEDQHPIVFVGSYPYPHPEHADARALVVRSLQSRYPRHFRVYRGGFRGARLDDLYAFASIVVGDSCLAGRSPRYWSDRVPETVGRAGFLIHPYVEGIEDEYVDGKHLRTYEPGDVHQLIGLVDWYLGHREERRRIADQGREHVLAEHTYRNRMDRLLREVLG